MTSPRPRALSQKYLVHQSSGEVDDEFRNLYAGVQQRNHRIVSAAPIASTIDEGEVQLFDDGTNRRIYTKINGTVRYVALT